MHLTALENADRFFKTYVPPSATVVDIGSQDVNGSLRNVWPHSYLGVDFVPGRGVDIVLDDPYHIPMADGSVDVVVSSSCFEHSEFFWLTFLEIMRVLKPEGLFYLNAPSNGDFHRYPVDCWRFYPDSGRALANWGRRSGLKCVVLESYTSNQKEGCYNDFVAVFVKDEEYAALYPKRICEDFSAYTNGSDGRKTTVFTQDQQGLKWELRRLRYFLATPEGRIDVFGILRDILRGKRKGIFPNRYVDPSTP